jgi:protease IV
MSNRRIGCFTVGLFIILCISLLLNLIFIGSRNSHLSASTRQERDVPDYDETVLVGGDGTSKIAHIDLNGLISSSTAGDMGGSMVEDLKHAFRQAAEDEKVRAIVLNIDSPGGEVTASDMIYNAVRKAREKKPVVVYMGSVAASGGYYVACGGSYLMANETTITGSIGVIIQTLNYQQLLGKVGLETVVFKSGQFKDILSGSREMTPEEKAYIQGLVMQTYEKFVGIVSEERKLPLEQLRNGIADGRIISGKDALGFQLINQVGHIEDAYAKAKELAGAPDAAIVKYEAPFRLGRLFRMFSSSEKGAIQVKITPDLMPSLQQGRLYFLPGFYAY